MRIVAWRVYLTVLTIIALGVGVVAGVASADACGRGFLQILMFRAYPEARIASDAEQLALHAGLLSDEESSRLRLGHSSRPRIGGTSEPRNGAALPAMPVDANSAQGNAGGASRYARALHAWRVERIARSVVRLQRRLDALVNTRRSNQKAYILLINEFKWLAVQPSPTGFVLTEEVYGPVGRGVQLFTTRRIIDALLDGSLSWQTAGAKNLITSRGSLDSKKIWIEVLRSAFVRQRAAVHARNGEQVKR